jgi:hypothetical protein
MSWLRELLALITLSGLTECLYRTKDLSGEENLVFGHIKASRNEGKVPSVWSSRCTNSMVQVSGRST